MQTNEKAFGLVIAYVIPGWLMLLGISHHTLSVNEWLTGPMSASPTVAGFLFASLASIGLGVFVSTVRWLLVDRVLQRKVYRSKTPSFHRLALSHQAFDVLVESHYRYYQFHANMLVSLPSAAMLRWGSGVFEWIEFISLLLAIPVLVLGAIDTFGKYHQRVGQLLGAGD